MAHAPIAIVIAAHERKSRGRKKLAATLPRIEIVHDLTEAEKRCAHDGTALERIGEEVSEQLDYQPARLQVLRHIRPKYACPGCRQGVHIAPVPVSIFPKSLATPALLAHIATAKFLDGLPLYRQEAQFARLGVTLGRATLAGWMIRLGSHIQPLINLLAEQMFSAPVIHCDETRLQVLHSDKAPTADQLDVGAGRRSTRHEDRALRLRRLARRGSAQTSARRLPRRVAHRWVCAL